MVGYEWISTIYWSALAVDGSKLLFLYVKNNGTFQFSKDDSYFSQFPDRFYF